MSMSRPVRGRMDRPGPVCYDPVVVPGIGRSRMSHVVLRPSRRSLAMVFLAALAAGPLALAGDDGPPIDAPSLLRARVLDLEGLDWRRDLHRGLDQVDNSGAASIWTADPGALGRLLARARTVRDVGIGDNSDRTPTIHFV